MFPEALFDIYARSCSFCCHVYLCRSVACVSVFLKKIISWNDFCSIQVTFVSDFGSSCPFGIYIQTHTLFFSSLDLFTDFYGLIKKQNKHQIKKTEIYCHDYRRKNHYTFNLSLSANSVHIANEKSKRHKSLLLELKQKSCFAKMDL